MGRQLEFIELRRPEVLRGDSACHTKLQSHLKPDHEVCNSPEGRAETIFILLLLLSCSPVKSRLIDADQNVIIGSVNTFIAGDAQRH